MKSLVNALCSVNISIFGLFFFATQSTIAMKLNPTISTLIEEKQKNISPIEISEAYYQKNNTVLISKFSLENTIKRILKVDNDLSVYENANVFETEIKAGARYLYNIAHLPEEKIQDMACDIGPADASNIIKYMYSLSCRIRPDKTGFSEGIIIVRPGNRYFKALKCFFKKYQKQIEENNKTGKGSSIPLIEKAKTSGAFRLMCLTNQGKKTPFLGKFEDFYIIISDDNIQIKPEKYPKVKIVNKVTAALFGTKKSGKKYNKPTDIPKEFSEEFVKIFPSKPISSISDMYKKLSGNLAKGTDEEKEKINDCITKFKKIGSKNRLPHLIYRIGSEIILDDEELSESYFAEKCDEKMSIEEKKARGIFLYFRALQDQISEYISNGVTDEDAEKIIRKSIDNFLDMVSNETLIATITDKEIRDYYLDTALTLKYIANLKDEKLPDTPAITLKKRLKNPVFEKEYQAKIDLKEFAKELNDQKKIEKINELGKILGKRIDSLTTQYSSTFPHQCQIDTDGNPSSIEKEETRKRFSPLYEKFIKKLSETLRKNADALNKTFPELSEKLTSFIKSIVGTTLEFAKTKDANEWIEKDRAETLQKGLKNITEDVTKLITDVGEDIEKAGYFWTTGKNSTKILHTRYTELSKNKNGEKYPAAIKKFKNTPQLFTSKESLIAAITEIYKKSTPK